MFGEVARLFIGNRGIVSGSLRLGGRGISLRAPVDSNVDSNRIPRIPTEARIFSSGGCVSCSGPAVTKKLSPFEKIAAAATDLNDGSLDAEANKLGYFRDFKNGGLLSFKETDGLGGFLVKIINGVPHETSAEVLDKEAKDQIIDATEALRLSEKKLKEAQTQVDTSRLLVSTLNMSYQRMCQIADLAKQERDIGGCDRLGVDLVKMSHAGILHMTAKGNKATEQHRVHLKNLACQEKARLNARSRLKDATEAQKIAENIACHLNWTEEIEMQAPGCGPG